MIFNTSPSQAAASRTSSSRTSMLRYALHQTRLHGSKHQHPDIVNINIAKVYINVVFRRCRQKNPAAAMIFDRRSRLRQDPPPS
jgi:hypothetical protein